MRFAALLFLAPLLIPAQVVVTNTAGAPVQAGAPAVPQPEVKPEDLCTVEGQILNAVSSEPVKKANVMLMRTNATPGPNSMPQIYSATSDAAGKFAMKGIEPGRYHIQVMRNGFVSMAYGARSPNRPGTVLSLDRGQAAKNIDFQMTPHGVVTGRILDDEGEPVPYANVNLMRFQYQQGRKVLSPSGNSSTNDLGDYRIFGVAPGKYYVSAIARGGMMPMGSMADRTPQPEEDYLPTYYPGTLDSGNAIPVEVNAGATVNGINLRLSKSRTVHVKGHVTTTSSTAQSGGRRLSVMMMPRNGSPFMGGMMSNPVDPKGNFDIRGVGPGSYSLYATLNEDGKTSTAKASVEVGTSNIENISLTLGPGADIAGLLRVEGETTQALSNIYIRLQPREMGGMFIGGLASSQLKEDRSFTLKGVGAETYNVAVTGLPPGFYLKAIKWGDVDVLATGLDAGKGAGEPLQIVVNPNAGEVNGTVQNSKTSQPAPGATVVLIPQEKERRDQQTWYRTATTDQNGNYSIKSIPPGDFKAFAWEDLEPGAYQDPDFMKPMESKGEAVTIKESDRKSIPLTLIQSESRP